MSDEKPVKFKVSADGTKEAAEGLSKVADQLDRQKLAVKAMDDAVAQSGYLARLAQYKAEAAALNAEQDKNAVTIQKLSAAVNENTQAFGDHSTKLRSQLGAGAGALQQLSQAFAQVSPEIGVFNGALDTGLRSMGGFLGVLGGGPGIVLGGLVAGLGILGTVLSASAKEADALAERTQKNSEAIKNYLANISALRSQVSGEASARTGESALQKRLVAGGGTSQDYLTEAAAQRQLAAQKVSVENLQLANKAGGQDAVTKLLDDYAAEIKAINKRFADLQSYATAASQNEADKAELEKALYEAGTPTEPNAKPRKDDASAFQGRLAANRAAIEAIRKMESESAQKQADEERDIQQAAFQRELTEKKDQLEQLNRQFASLEYNKTELVKTNLDEQKRLLEQQIGETVSTLHAQDAEQMVQAEQLKRDALTETRDLFLQLEDDKSAKIQETIQLEKQSRTQMNQSAMALGTTLAQLTARQLSEAAKGHKIQAALILEGIGDAMVAEGVRVMFQGGASLLMGNYVGGAGLLALGAAEIGVGLGLGAAGAAAQPPAPAGGEPTTNQSSPVRDTSATSNGATERGPTIIYIDMPTVVSPSAEDGVRVRQAIDAASRVYGAPV